MKTGAKDYKLKTTLSSGVRTVKGLKTTKSAGIRRLKTVKNIRTKGIKTAKTAKNISVLGFKKASAKIRYIRIVGDINKKTRKLKGKLKGKKKIGLKENIKEQIDLKRRVLEAMTGDSNADIATNTTVDIAKTIIAIKKTIEAIKIAAGGWQVTLVIGIIILLLCIIMSAPNSFGVLMESIIDDPSLIIDAALEMLFGEIGGMDYYDMVFPIPEGFVFAYSSPYGVRTHPVNGGYDFHEGVDLSADKGTPVVSVESGTITLGYQAGGAGNYLKLKTASGGEWIYMHLRDNKFGATYAKGIKNGSKVFAGQVIAYVGTTGSSSGDHLHIGKKVKGKYIDPTSLLFLSEFQRVEVKKVGNEYIFAGIPDLLDYNNIGALALRYESTGDIAAISNISGDWGGKSYGLYQIATGTGTMSSFMSWLKNKDSSIYTTLNNAREKDGGYGSNFDSAWKSISKNKKDQFYKIQHNYIYDTHYLVAIEGRSELTKRSKALNAVIFSTAVQHGGYGAKTILSKVNLSKNDKNIIKQIYAERSKVNVYFASQTQETKNNLIIRFKNEEIDALAMLEKETGG